MFLFARAGIDETAEKNISPDSDGAPAAQGGSDLHEPEYDVEVKLSDLQDDPNNPLYSAKSFEELELWVFHCCFYLFARQG